MPAYATAPGRQTHGRLAVPRSGRSSAAVMPPSPSPRDRYTPPSLAPRQTPQHPVEHLRSPARVELVERQGRDVGVGRIDHQATSIERTCRSDTTSGLDLERHRPNARSHRDRASRTFPRTAAGHRPPQRRARGSAVAPAHRSRIRRPRAEPSASGPAPRPRSPTRPRRHAGPAGPASRHAGPG